MVCRFLSSLLHALLLGTLHHSVQGMYPLRHANEGTAFDSSPEQKNPVVSEGVQRDSEQSLRQLRQVGTDHSRAVDEHRIHEVGGEHLKESGRNAAKLPRRLANWKGVKLNMANAQVSLGPNLGFRDNSIGVDSVIDGETGCSEWARSPEANFNTCEDNTYVTIDLGGWYLISAITLFHYFCNDRRYCNQKVILSESSSFSDAFVPYDTGTNYGDLETSAGKTIYIPETKRARYIRHYCGRSTSNSGVHFLEVEVYHVPYSCSSDSDCGDGACGRENYSTSGNYICCPSGETEIINLMDFCTGDFDYCESHSDCDNDACGRPNANTDAGLVCCPSGSTTNYAFYDYCTGMTAGTQCFSSAMCADGLYCKRECTGGVCTSYCRQLKASGASCGYNGECTSGDCDGDWLGFCPCYCT